jgi:hypothetical protein
MIGLLASYLEKDSSGARAVEFAEEDSLPGPEPKGIVAYYYALATAEEGAFAMGVGIALGVPVAGVMRRYQFGQCQKDIVHDIGVGIFVYGYGGCCVGAVNYYVAVGDAGLPDGRGDLARYVNHLVAAFSAYGKIFFDDFHFGSLSHLLDDFDTEKFTQALFDGLASQITEQQSCGSFVRRGL